MYSYIIQQAHICWLFSTVFPSPRCLLINRLCVFLALLYTASKASQDSQQFLSCAENRRRGDCESARGLGATTGRCQWRQGTERGAFLLLDTQITHQNYTPCNILRSMNVFFIKWWDCRLVELETNQNLTGNMFSSVVVEQINWPDPACASFPLTSFLQQEVTTGSNNENMVLIMINTSSNNTIWWQQHIDVLI